MLWLISATKVFVPLVLMFVASFPKTYTVTQRHCGSWEIARLPCFPCFSTAVESNSEKADPGSMNGNVVEIIIPLGESNLKDSGAQLREHASILQTMSFGDEEKYAVQNLINMLIEEVEGEIQGENDLWLASEAWNAAELLYADPSRFIQSPYAAEEVEGGMATSVRTIEDTSKEI